MKKSVALKTLGLSDGATDDQIKKAHRKLVIENHPDRYAQDPAAKAAAEEKTKLINEARDVLISRKWDPEFDPRRAGSSSSPYGGSSVYGTPYGGHGDAWNFNPEDFDFIWTAWGGEQQPRGAHSAPIDPFASVYTQVPTKTPEQEATEAKEALRFEIAGILFKALLLGCSALFDNLAAGMFCYVLISLVLSVYKRLGGCSYFVLLPALVVLGPAIILMMPRVGADVGIGVIIFFALAVLFDLSNVRLAFQTYRGASTKAKV